MKSVEKFSDLGLDNDILAVLKEKGFKEPTEIQKKTIPLTLIGRDIIGGSATGSGKTLAFASSIIQNLRPNHLIQALILTPTRELAEQVADSFKLFSKYKKIKVQTIYGGVNIEPQIKGIKIADIVIGTPGRILDHLERKTLSLKNIKYLVLDEADRMFDMGFQYDVEKIISFCPKERQTMLFSATISPEIDYLAKKHTKKPVEITVESYIEPSKLKQIYYDIENHLKFSLLVHLLKNEKSKLVMVFCSSRRNVDFVVKNLQKVGIYSSPLHGGMSQNKRTKMLENFHKNKVDVLVCTDVAARGLDIPEISHVYNYDLPRTSDDYIHRIGRTARAGKDGIAISLLSDRDYENFQRIEKNEKLKIECAKTPYVEKIVIKKDFATNKRKDRRVSSRGGYKGKSNYKVGNKRGDESREKRDKFRGQKKSRSFSKR